MDWILCLILTCLRYDGLVVTVWKHPHPPKPPYVVGVFSWSEEKRMLVPFVHTGIRFE